MAAAGGCVGVSPASFDVVVAQRIVAGPFHFGAMQVVFAGLYLRKTSVDLALTLGAGAVGTKACVLHFDAVLNVVDRLAVLEAAPDLVGAATRAAYALALHHVTFLAFLVAHRRLETLVGLLLASFCSLALISHAFAVSHLFGRLRPFKADVDLSAAVVGIGTAHFQLETVLLIFGCGCVLPAQGDLTPASILRTLAASIFAHLLLLRSLGLLEAFFDLILAATSHALALRGPALALGTLLIGTRVLEALSDFALAIVAALTQVLQIFADTALLGRFGVLETLVDLVVAIALATVALAGFLFAVAQVFVSLSVLEACFDLVLAGELAIVAQLLGLFAARLHRGVLGIFKAHVDEDFALWEALGRELGADKHVGCGYRSLEAASRVELAGANVAIAFTVEQVAFCVLFAVLRAVVADLSLLITVEVFATLPSHGFAALNVLLRHGGIKTDAHSISAGELAIPRLAGIHTRITTAFIGCPILARPGIGWISWISWISSRFITTLRIAIILVEVDVACHEAHGEYERYTQMFEKFEMVSRHAPTFRRMAAIHEEDYGFVTVRKWGARRFMAYSSHRTGATRPICAHPDLARRALARDFRVLSMPAKFCPDCEVACGACVDSSAPGARLSLRAPEFVRLLAPRTTQPARGRFMPPLHVPLGTVRVESSWMSQLSRAI